MCGIAGILSFKDKVTLQSLKTMTDTIVHRGPDGEGQWVNHNGQIGFGHRRLSIIDLSELGKQPMHYLYMRYTITFNGEIYNYREIKNDLIKAGYRFISETDTEVLLALYDLKKERCLENLDGMFAFAIWDESTQELFCARDRFGEKPFYYTIYNNQFIFGSEMKEIFSIGVPKTVNYNMVYNYLENDLVENPLNKQETFFENIYKLEAATYLKVKDKKIKKIKYWEINLKNRSEVSFAEAEKEFTRLFEISISRRLRSDVPVGSSLSGGLDSSSVVARINKILQNNTTQKTFSARFHNKDFDEGKFMLQIQKKFNLDSYYVYPDSNTLLKNLDLVYHHQEEPFGSASILAQWEVMRLAKQNNVSVLLDGQGADEFLSGYHKYFPTYLFELAKQDKIKYNHHH